MFDHSASFIFTRVRCLVNAVSSSARVCVPGSTRTWQLPHRERWIARTSRISAESVLANEVLVLGVDAASRADSLLPAHAADKAPLTIAKARA
jgi:hypothetical protein